VLARLGVGEGGNNVSEGRQRLVDLFALLKALASCASYSDTLATCQIYEVELSNFNFAGSIKGFHSVIVVIGYRCHLLYDDQENCVGARRKIVHFGCSCRSAKCTSLH